jgi:hypothetical protein
MVGVLAGLAAGLTLIASVSVANAAPATVAVRYTFDGGVAHLNRGVGNEPLLVTKTAQGGTIRSIAHGSGEALEFPALCAHPGASTCARAIVETTGNDSALNPGTRPISFGATVRIGSHRTSDGENILQKGYATAESEYKLQVDGLAGKPSCAVVGTSTTRIYLAKSSVAINNGVWHTLSCVRTAGTLSVMVDGTTRGSVSVPASLSITNGDDLRLGGKGTSANNDQFDGELDDVWITVG